MPCQHIWDNLVVMGIRWADMPVDPQGVTGIIDVAICRNCGAVDYSHPFLGKLFLERKEAR